MKSKYSEVFEILRPKLKKADEICCINSGGCGFVALEIHKVLTEHRIKHTLIYGFRAKNEYFNNTNDYINNKSDKPSAPSHAVIAVGNKYIIDSEGIKPYYALKYDMRFNIKIFIRKNKREFLKASLSNKKAWNQAFNRKSLKELREAFK